MNFEEEIIKLQNRVKELERVGELKWAAGLFDGEGCFHISNTRKDTSYSIQSALQMTDIEGVEDFHSIVKIGKLKPVDKGPIRKRQYKWYCYSEDVFNVAKLLQPYLKIKYRQAKLMLEFASVYRRRKAGSDGPGREDSLTVEEFGTLDIICHEMAVLNKRGV